MNTRLRALAVAAAFAVGVLGLTSPGLAQHGDEHGATHPSAPRPPAAPPGAHGQVLDSRHNHGQYYPPMGAGYRSLPPGYRPYVHHGTPYYCYGGVWYAPGGPGFVVVRPPVGLVVYALPAYTTTVWIAGNPYYYANNVYYTWQPDQSAYVVAEPPADADPSGPPDGAAAQDDVIAYPKNGQTIDQQAADRFECHQWAKGQTGFDPTLPGGGLGPSMINTARGNYNRAMSACLQARGYEVK
jgi:hypothetical protein